MSTSKKLITLIVGTVGVLVVTLGIVGYLVLSSSGNENAKKTLVLAQKSMQMEIDTKLEVLALVHAFLGHGYQPSLI